MHETTASKTGWWYHIYIYMHYVTIVETCWDLQVRHVETCWDNHELVKWCQKQQREYFSIGSAQRALERPSGIWIPKPMRRSSPKPKLNRPWTSRSCSMAADLTFESLAPERTFWWQSHRSACTNKAVARRWWADNMVPIICWFAICNSHYPDINLKILAMWRLPQIRLVWQSYHARHLTSQLA